MYITVLSYSDTFLTYNNIYSVSIEQTTLCKNKPTIITISEMESPLLVEKVGINNSLLYVRSERKAQNEIPMKENFTSHFETWLKQVLEWLQKKGITKVIQKAWERIRRLKKKFPNFY